MPPSPYYAKSKAATGFVRSHVFVGVGQTEAEAVTMWNQLAQEAEQTLATAQYDVKFHHRRPLEDLHGIDNPATDYPATDYPAFGLPKASPNAPLLRFFTAMAIYQEVAKKPAVATAKKKTTAQSKKRAVSPKR